MSSGEEMGDDFVGQIPDTHYFELTDGEIKALENTTKRPQSKHVSPEKKRSRGLSPDIAVASGRSRLEVTPKKKGESSTASEKALRREARATAKLEKEREREEEKARKKLEREAEKAKKQEKKEKKKKKRDENETTDSSDSNGVSRSRGKVILSKKEIAKERTASAKKRGKNLQKKAEEFESITGGRVYLEAEYKGHSKVMHWNYGTQFMDIGGTSTKDAGRKTQPEIEMKDMMKALSKEIAALKSTKQKEIEVLNDSDEGGNFASPKKSVTRKKVECFECAGTEDWVRSGASLFKSEWIGCSCPGCNVWIHADCAGFPGVKASVIENKMPHYYCRQHRDVGRKANKVEEKPTHHVKPKGKVLSK